MHERKRKKQKKPTRKKKTRHQRRKRKRKKGRTRANDRHSKTQKRRKKFDRQKSIYTDKDNKPEVSLKETQKTENQTAPEYETDDEQRSDLLGLGYDEEPSKFEDLSETKPKHSTADYHEEEAAIGLLEKLLETERQARNIMGSQEDTDFDTAQLGNENININKDTTAKPPKKKKKKKKRKTNNKTTKTTSKKKNTKKNSKCSWYKRKRQDVKRSYQNFKRQNCLNRRVKAATSYDTLMLLYKQLFDITKSSNIVAEHIGDYKTFISSVKKFLEVNPICFTNLQWNHVLIKVYVYSDSKGLSHLNLFFRFAWTISRNFV